MQEKILEAIDTYRYMTYDQIKRKIWRGKNRSQIAKHFSASKRKELVEKGLLRENEGIFTRAEGDGTKHSILITDTLLDIEERAEELGIRFSFTFDRLYQDFIPDATLYLEKDGMYHLAFLEVQLQEKYLEEKKSKYESLAKVGFIPTKFLNEAPKEWGFSVLVITEPRQNFEGRFIGHVENLFKI